jgi:hypothetical protein
MDASPSESRPRSGLPYDDPRSRDTHQDGLRWSPGRRALSLIGFLGLLASAGAAALPAERSPIRSTSYQLPLTFEVNQGQTDARVDFLARGQGYTLFLTSTEAVFALTPPVASSKRSGNGRESDAPQPGRTVMRMQLVGSAAAPQMRGLEELPGKVHYFRGNDSTHWRTNVRTYKRVKYTAVYPGVDLVYYGQPQQLEYDFIVAPGADPSTIKLAFSGVDESIVDAKGDLVLKTAGAPLRFQRPIIYQVESGRRRTVEGGYVHRSSREIGFQVGAYDRTRPLIIDPVLTYSTYLGGSSEDHGQGIAVDATGAVYVTGFTYSTDFPTMNALQPTLGAEFTADVFVAKLTADGAALIYATYLGGNRSDGAREALGSDVAVDAAGNAYITGGTASPDFPTVRALQVALKGQTDAFVAKLSADGSQLIYSTFLGGTGGDGGQGIEVDLTGAAYLTGGTGSPDFPTTADAFQPVCSVNTGSDAFVAKLTPEGTALAYSTCFGGSADEGGSDIAVDSLGAAYVTGTTGSADFPAVNPAQPFTSAPDAFVAKVAPDGKRLIYSTPLGGSNVDSGYGIAVDMSGGAYVTGQTYSVDFPTVNPLQPVGGDMCGPFLDCSDAFVVKLPPEGGSYVYATYLGGFFSDSGAGIAVDTAGAAYVGGFTDSFDFPFTDPVEFIGVAFVAKLVPDGRALAYSTGLGGGSGPFDGGFGIAVDASGSAYVTGVTSSNDFPTVRPLQTTLAGVTDAFVAKLSGDGLACPPEASTNGEPVNDSISGSESGGDSGGGSIDALLAVLLAQLAFAQARRRRIETRDRAA